MGAVATRWQVAAVLTFVCALPAPEAGSARQGTVPADDVLPILLKATSYLAEYVTALSSVVSEERYVQTYTRRGDSARAEMTLSRTLQSDYLLVALAGSGEWLPFRDVYAVDGVPVRDRSDRLLKLFVESPPGAYAQALRIRNESSRYNIGPGIRDTNVPTFALQVLSPAWRGSFAFRLRSSERIGETDATVVEYRETGSPTLVGGKDNQDVPSRGRLWIDPADGRILRTLFETRPAGWVNTLEVRYRHEPKLGLLVPSEMIERRDAGSETLEGRATYTNFRRFRVDTSMEIK
jgi:hypothetical protein